MTIPQTFEVALQHHQAGRLAEAEALYRQILAVEPRHADALHLLGVIAHQVGQNDVAVELIRQTIALKPDYPGAYNNLGVALKDSGQLDEAVAAYHHAIALQPVDPEAHYNLGNALHEKGRLEEAMAAYRQAIALKPDYLKAHHNLGNALKDKGQLSEAIAAYGQALAVCPDDAEAHYNLGNALHDQGQLEEAIAAYRQAIALKPDYPMAYNNLGIGLRDKGETEEAVAAYRQAVALQPDLAEAYSNLGVALKDHRRLDEAIAACREAIALKPNDPEARNNLGVCLYDKGQLDEAIAAFRQAVALKPNYAEAHNNLSPPLKDEGQLDEAVAACRQAIALQSDFAEAHLNLGLALLVQGNFAEGWREYEWRWKAKDFSPARDFSQPQWDGRALAGRTLLLHAEQGFGDALQFIRYVPLVAQRGGKIVIECRAELRRLFQAMFADFPVVIKGEPLPVFDLHCPLLSLPRLFATDLSNIPRTVPYLHAAAAEAGIWRDRLAGDATSFKVGLAWAGRPSHQNDRHRSLKLAAFGPLARVSDVQCYSLQKGDAGAEAKNPPRGMELVDVAEELKDFADTAALIANLDLVIAVDTAVVHLAGAMGKPVWTLLPFAPDWRWLIERTDSPWYPTMRLFRQPRIGDWDAVIAEVCAQLQLLVQKRRDVS